MRGGGWSLKIAPLESPYPFVNVPFDILIHVIDNVTQTLRSGEEIDLNIELLSQDSNGIIELVKEDLMVIGIKNPHIPRSGTLSLPITLKETSMNYSNKKFLIHVSSSTSHLTPPTTPASSTPLFVITHRLALFEPSLPSLWYKDQGGKSNWLSLPVKLLNHGGQIVLNRRVYLTLTLLYATNGISVPVPNQEILNIASPAAVAIGDPGYTIIRFRIEEVSRSHQNQSFILRISPDLLKDPKGNDISSVETSPIHVMSKARGAGAGGRDSNGVAPSSLPSGNGPPPVLKKRGRDGNSNGGGQESKSAAAAPAPPATLTLLEWSNLAFKELCDLRQSVDSLIQSYHHSSSQSHIPCPSPSSPAIIPTMSLFPFSESSVLIPPHYPPHLFTFPPTHHQPDPSVHSPPQEIGIDPESGDSDRGQRRRVAFAITTPTLDMKESRCSSISEDSELLLTLHRQMCRPVLAEQTEEECMSLQDLPSGLIREGLDGTVNVAESAREWNDKQL